MKHTIEILILLLFANIVFAQAPQWKVYNTGNSGLPLNTVGNIAFDSNGVAWIACGGLVRFDGINWTIYDTTNSGLPDNFITDISIDVFNHVWVTTFRGGVAKFDGVNWLVYNVNNSGLPANQMISLDIDSNNIKWFVQGQLTKYNDTNWTIYTDTNAGLPLIPYRVIDIDPTTNSKWIGTRDGVIHFFDTGTTIYNSSNSGLPYDDVRDLYIDKFGVKWIAVHFGGLAKFNSSINKWTVYDPNNSGCPGFLAISVTLDTNYNRWIGFVGTGMAKFSGDSSWSIFNTNNSPIPSDIVNDLTVDRYQNIWISTGEGLAVYNENGIVSVSNTSENLPKDYILFQNYPNPFNPETSINYELRTANNVRLEIYNINGQKLSTLIDSKQGAGEYIVVFNGEGLASGIYYYALFIDNVLLSSKKMILLK